MNFSKQYVLRCVIFPKPMIMKYEKLMANIFARNSTNNTTVAIAVIAGLAVGAVLGVLFAPESGDDVRKSLRNRITGSDPSEQSLAEYEEQQLTPATVKKPKSDIKELIHEAHVNGIHTEQSLN